MSSAQVVETSVANNIPSQDSSHADDLFDCTTQQFTDLSGLIGMVLLSSLDRFF